MMKLRLPYSKRVALVAVSCAACFMFSATAATAGSTDPAIDGALDTITSSVPDVVSKGRAPLVMNSIGVITICNESSEQIQYGSRTLKPGEYLQTPLPPESISTKSGEDIHYGFYDAKLATNVVGDLMVDRITPDVPKLMMRGFMQAIGASYLVVADNSNQLPPHRD
ncbi:MAG: hypothetical protein D3903_02325 [Candidatus Electrothrix sp. GM3_4]|nr:hypothetical protein [Candidatus Electrothrix sp. GM3_4]